MGVQIPPWIFFFLQYSEKVEQVGNNIASNTMFTTLTTGYFLASVAHSYHKTKLLYTTNNYPGATILENKDELEGILIKNFVKHVEGPVYMNMHNQGPVGLSVPINNGKITERENSKPSWDFCVNKHKKVVHRDCEFLDEPAHHSYINTQHQLISFSRQYPIDINTVPVRLPLSVYKYTITPQSYILKSNNYGTMIGCDKYSIIHRFVSKSRLPFSYTAGVFGLLGILSMIH